MATTEREQIVEIMNAVEYITLLDNVIDPQGNVSPLFERVALIATEELRDIMEKIAMPAEQAHNAHTALEKLILSMLLPSDKGTVTFDLGDGERIDLTLTHRELLAVIRRTLMDVLGLKGEQK